jgi:hypothetical protein
VTFQAASGYKLVSADVKDPAGLGWKPDGAFSFKLTVREDLRINTFHVAHFYGKLKPIGGPGPGGGAEVLLDWDLDGQFKVFGEHEGVGDDLGRDPVASLVSSKPGGGPQSVGQATYDQAKGEFIGDGSFKEGGKVYLGAYYPVPCDADLATYKPEQLGEAEEKDCPEGDKVKVKFVYFGCTTAGGIGGKADPDEIKINGFSPADGLLALQQALAQAETAYQAALAAEAAAKTAAETAQQDAATKQKAYEELLKQDSGVQKAQERLTKAQEHLKKAQENPAYLKEKIALENAKKAWDKWLANRDTLVAGGGLANWQSTLNSLEEDVAKHQAKVQNFEQQIQELAQAVQAAADALTAAQQKAAEQSAAIAAAKAAAEAAAAQAATLQTAYQQAMAASAQAKQVRDDAKKQYDDALAEANAVQLAWLEVYAGILAHEQGHRRICYHHTDKMTDTLNHLRAWGYALAEQRAAQLGGVHFQDAWTREWRDIRKADKNMQTKYDSDTNHGGNQNNWDWNQLQ